MHQGMIYNRFRRRQYMSSSLLSLLWIIVNLDFSVDNQAEAYGAL
jgi:hypothetical protein